MTIATILMNLTFRYTAMATEKPKHFLFHKTLRRAGKESTQNCHLSFETVSCRSQHSFFKVGFKKFVISVALTKDFGFH